MRGAKADPVFFLRWPFSKPKNYDCIYYIGKRHNFRKCMENKYDELVLLIMKTIIIYNEPQIYPLQVTAPLSGQRS